MVVGKERPGPVHLATHVSAALELASSAQATAVGYVDAVVVVVGFGRVATVVEVGGTKVDDVGGGWVVVVVSSAVVVVVTGTVVTTVPVDVGEVVATGARVVVVVPDGAGATVVEVGSTEVEVEVAEELDVVAAGLVVVGRAVVTGDWVATCCLGEVSRPTATSKSRATRATLASA